MEAAMERKKTKVLIVDDCAYPLIITGTFTEDPRLEVVATASDPYEARDKIKRFNPDVITLDIEMPKMNGIAFKKPDAPAANAGSDDFYAYPSGRTGDFASFGARCGRLCRQTPRR